MFLNDNRHIFLRYGKRKQKKHLIFVLRIFAISFGETQVFGFGVKAIFLSGFEPQSFIFAVKEKNIRICWMNVVISCILLYMYVFVSENTKFHRKYDILLYFVFVSVCDYKCMSVL